MSDASEHSTMLADSVGRLLRDASAVQSRVSEGWNAELWSQVDEMGLPLLLVPEEHGGIGGHWDDAHVVLHALGAHAVALPVGESMLARRLLALAAIDAPAGLVGLAPRVDRRARLSTPALRAAARYTGTLDGVPWGRHLQSIVAVVAQDERGVRDARASRSAAASIARSDQPRRRAARPAAVRVGRSARGRMRQARSARPPAPCARCCASARSPARWSRRSRARSRMPPNASSSASRSAASRPCSSSSRCSDRKSPPSAARARAAFRAATIGDASFEIAAAKLRANLAIDACTAIAHQVHGAIGFTHEYDLRHFTQRLWSWRTRVRQRPALERGARQRGDRARRRCLLGRPHAARRRRRDAHGNNVMTDAVIVSTARTAIGKAFRGALNNTHGATMGGHVIAEAVRRAGIAPDAVDDVLLGCAWQEGATGSNIARQAALRAGLPVEVPAATLDRKCASGLDTIAIAANRIRCGEAERHRRRRARIGVAGAGPSQHLSREGRVGARASNRRLRDDDPDRRERRAALWHRARRAGRVCARKPAPHRGRAAGGALRRRDRARST